MNSELALSKLAQGLTAQLGRAPTEDEVMQFVFGNDEMRREIWNGKGVRTRD